MGPRRHGRPLRRQSGHRRRHRPVRRRRGAARGAHGAVRRETEVDGVRVRHYRGTADLTTASRAASEGNRAPLRAAARGFATARVPFDAYLDDEGRIRKVRHRFSFVNGGGQGTVAVASTTLLFDFGVPVAVRLPRPEDIYAGKIAEE